MKMTDEQYELMTKYEEKFRIIRDSKTLRSPGINGAKEIFDVYKTIVKATPNLCLTCATSVFRMMSEMATFYFADKEERNARVTTTQMEAAPQEKVTVKTEKKHRKRK